MKLVVLLILTLPCWAQSVLSLSCPNYTPGQTLICTVHKTGGLPTSLQMTFNPDIKTPAWTPAVGGTAMTAGKAVQCGTTKACVIWAMNTTVIADGDIMQFMVTVPANATGILNYSITVPVEAALDASSIPTTTNPPVSVSSAISLPTPCDVNGDGRIDSLDVTGILTQVISGAVFSTAYDLNKDSKNDVLDLQIVINAVNGGVCTAQ